MFQEFFTRTIESKFIKNILYNTPLPTYKTVRDGDYVFGGCTYIYKNDIIRVNYTLNNYGKVEFDGSGFLGFIPSNLDSSFPISDKVLASYTIIDSYVFGEMYYKFTERFISEFGYYDSATHEHLGDYLRCVRNLYNVDLMPFYNCYSGRYATNLSIALSHQLDYYTLYKWKEYKLPILKSEVQTETKEFKGVKVKIKYSDFRTCVYNESKKEYQVELLKAKEDKLDSYMYKYIKIVEVDEYGKEKDSNVIFVSEGTSIELTHNSCLISNYYNIYCDVKLPEIYYITSSTNGNCYPEDGWYDGCWYSIVKTNQWYRWKMWEEESSLMDIVIVNTGCKNIDNNIQIIYGNIIEIDENGNIVLVEAKTHTKKNSYKYCCVKYKISEDVYTLSTVYRLSTTSSKPTTIDIYDGPVVLNNVKTIYTVMDSKYEIVQNEDITRYKKNGYQKDEEDEYGYWYKLDESGKQISETKGSLLAPFYKLMNYANNEYKLLQISIKYNQDYTISIDTDCEVYLIPAILKNSKRVTIFSEDREEIDLSDRLYYSVKKLESSKYKHPFKFRVDLTKSNNLYPYLANNERYLCLLIQLPKTEVTSITVLEGDFTIGEECSKYFNLEDFDEVEQSQKDKLLLSRLALLKLNDKVSYAFSDRLIEYLTKNTITSLEEIDNNIIMVQEKQGLIGNKIYAKGIWDDKIRIIYYQLMEKNKKIEHYDLTGYIDKDTEKWYT